MKNILVTGGAGYIGSHMTRMLLEEGFRPVVLDNLEQGHTELVPKGVEFIQADLNVPEEVEAVFAKHSFDAVMHFAGLIVVPESVYHPHEYYRSNVGGSINLLGQVLKHKIKYFIFSSTAAIYGNIDKFPITEDSPANPQNPYAHSKRMIEIMLEDAAKIHPLKYMCLRYFNVCGSHPKCDIGVMKKKPTHIVPNIMRALNGRQDVLEVYGNDYPTKDGTCLRDYVYIVDLCRGHLKALQALEAGAANDIINLGSSQGFTVKEIIDNALKVTGKQIKIEYKPRRLGDVPKLVASNEKALKVLNWKPEASLETMLKTAWMWEQYLAARSAS